MAISCLTCFPHRISDIPDLVPNMAVSCFMCFPSKVRTERIWFQTWPFHALRASHSNFNPNGPGSKHGCFICVRFPIEFQTYRTWFLTWPFHILCVSPTKFKQNRFGSKHCRFMLYVFPIRITAKMDLGPNMAVSFLCVFPLNNGSGSKRGRFIFTCSRLNFIQNGPGSQHGRFIHVRFPIEFQTYRTWFQTWAFHVLCVPLAKFE